MLNLQKLRVSCRHCRTCLNRHPCLSERLWRILLSMNDATNSRVSPKNVMWDLGSLARVVKMSLKPKQQAVTTRASWRHPPDSSGVGELLARALD